MSPNIVSRCQTNKTNLLFIKWFGTEPAYDHHLIQWWLMLLTHICVTGPRCITLLYCTVSKGCAHLPVEKLLHFQIHLQFKCLHFDKTVILFLVRVDPNCSTDLSFWQMHSHKYAIESICISSDSECGVSLVGHSFWTKYLNFLKPSIPVYANTHRHLMAMDHLWYINARIQWFNIYIYTYMDQGIHMANGVPFCPRIWQNILFSVRQISYLFKHKNVRSFYSIFMAAYVLIYFNPPHTL